jgi:methylated-DNA-[protein]-cysteine S-methyltransferase
MAQLSFHSPIGDLTVSEEDGIIVSLDFGWSPFQTKNEILSKAKFWCDSYFDGENPLMDLPLAPFGTKYQRQIYKAIQGVSYGKTKTYSQIAEITASHSRPVGRACGSNPIPLLIPCHRVMGKNGSLTGYSGGEGTETKKFLLELEKATC